MSRLGLHPPVISTLGRRTPVVAFNSAVADAVAATEAPLPPPPVEKFRKDYEPLPWSVASISLSFNLEDGESDEDRATTVSSVLNMAPSDANPGTPVDLVMDCENVELSSVTVDGVAVTDFTLENDKLTIPASALPLSKPFVLETVSLVAPASNLQLSGLYKSSGMFCTQCEAEGFRRITPYFDRPDVMTSFKVYMEADLSKYPILLSNGNKVDSGPVEGKEGRHFAVWEDPFKKPSYLFALVAGDLGSIKDTFTTASGRAVSLEIFSEHGNVDQLDHAMASVHKAMKWDEDRYGLEYDLDVYNIVAVNDFNMGAMENKGLNVFNTALTLAKASTATDADFERIESVIGHEYFHNWSGNRVTCRDWFQLTLKEGLTVYRDQEFSADMGSPAVVRIDNVRSLRARQFPEDGGPMAHPIRPESYIAMDNFYTATVYEKGAEVIRMYETVLGGRAPFRKGIDLYFERHDGQAVTCDDFRASMEDANKKGDGTAEVSLKQFERWYTQPGTPTVVASDAELDPTTNSWSITLTQSCRDPPGQGEQSSPLPFHIPVVVGLLDAATGEEVMPSQTLQLTDTTQQFTLEGLVKPGTQAVVPSLLRGFSAPVRLELVPELEDAELAFLAEHDTDAFNKWEASQQLAQRVLLDTALYAAAGDELDDQPLPDTLLKAFQGTLATATSEGVDLNLVAYALALPSLSELSDSMLRPVDPLALVAARKHVKKALATAARAQLAAVYEATSPKEGAAFSVSGPEIGRRALRNLCLDYLSSLDDDQAASRALTQFESASCMTDKLAALSALVARGNKEGEEECPSRKKALAAFYADAAGDALVLNKWFSVQAGHGSLAEVKTLMEHPEYSWTNPNRLRSVVSVFAGGNLKEFHALSGAGYAFIGDVVLKVDQTNNQAAARLCGSFSLWKKYDPSRQALMKAQLSRIKDAPGVSKDVFEIASRSLA